MDRNARPLPIVFFILIMLGCASLPRAKITNQTPSSQSTLYSISKINEIEPFVHNLSEKSLVIWDVDYVLITPTQLLGRPAAEEIRNTLFPKMARRYGLSAFKNQIKKVLTAMEWGTVEQDIVGVLEKLQKRKIPTVALTAMPYNSFDYAITDTMKWRADILNRLGIHFDWAYLPKRHVWDNAVGYDKGIVFSGKVPKGLALMQFLEESEFHPEKVVFIDDKLENIRSVQEACEKANIPSIGIHYQAAAFASDPKPDIRILRQQARTFLDKGIWISDEKAPSYFR